MSYKKELLTFIKERREELGLTQDEFAKHLEISLRALQGYERFESVPKPETIDKLCTFLGISAADIFRNKDNKFSSSVMSAIDVLSDSFQDEIKRNFYGMSPADFHKVIAIDYEILTATTFQDFYTSLTIADRKLWFSSISKIRNTKFAVSRMKLLTGVLGYQTRMFGNKETGRMAWEIPQWWKDYLALNPELKIQIKIELIKD